MTGPLDRDDLLSHAGRLLYRELPEEYRFLDVGAGGEPGDLETFLHGFGHLLDLIRHTTEQAHADSFAEPLAEDWAIQPWLLPYLAELIGARLRVPDPVQRRHELNRAVAWYQAKGTLTAADDIADVFTGTEGVVVEGWSRTLQMPRLGLPPFSVSPTAVGDGDPLGPPAIPPGLPDLRLRNRAVPDPGFSGRLQRLRLPQRDALGRSAAPLETNWRPSARRGAPCFPFAYDDTAARMPDVRQAGPGPLPGRSIVHFAPPAGFFEPGLRRVTLPASADPLGLAIGTGETQTLGPAGVLLALGLDPAEAADRLVVEGDLTVPPGASVAFHDLLFTGTLRVIDPGSRLTLHRCAAATLVLGATTEAPAVLATDCLIDTLTGGAGFAQLVYCTVLGETAIERLWASDCLFVGPMIDLDCAAEGSCIRFSRVPPAFSVAGCAAEAAPSITRAAPRFIRLWFDDAAGCVRRAARFGEPGAGVLALDAPRALREGAEDESELGAYHHRAFCATARALALKLAEHVPFGESIVLRDDPHLARPPLAAS